MGPQSDGARQDDLFASIDGARALIDQLIAETELYTTSEAFTDLLAFVTKLRSFAPFNAMRSDLEKLAFFDSRNTYPVRN